MPELPEVETVKRGLEPVMAGARFARVELRRPDLRFPFPRDFVARLEGRQVDGLTRRAKYILVHIAGGDVLAMHLGMSGRFTIAAPESGLTSAPGDFTHATAGGLVHDHVVFHMSNGAVITFNDPRRFGYMDLFVRAELEQHKHFKDLGVEPLSNQLDAVWLGRKAAGRVTEVKAFLMDQRVIAGLGNIYVCEVLFRAGLKPTRRSGSLSGGRGRASERCEALVHAIRSVLGEAIEAGGSSLRDYKHVNGELGYFQKAHQVYDREGSPCMGASCSGKIARLVQAGRSTFYCPRCQN
jgi:formamidopyrimidine-DNA glycosylase